MSSKDFGTLALLLSIKTLLDCNLIEETKFILETVINEAKKAES